MSKDGRDRGRDLVGWFFAAAIGSLLLVTLATGYPLATRLAGAGGFMAAIGVILIGRPVLRVGVYTWIANRHFREVIPAADQAPDKADALDDELAQNVFGPVLVGMGTVLNGFSGFFGP